MSQQTLVLTNKGLENLWHFNEFQRCVEIEAPTQSYIPLIFCIYIFTHTHIYIQYIRVNMYILDVWASNLDTVMQRGRPQFHPSTFLWACSFILLGTAKSATICKQLVSYLGELKSWTYYCLVNLDIFSRTNYHYRLHVCIVASAVYESRAHTPKLSTSSITSNKIAVRLQNIDVWSPNVASGFRWFVLDSLAMWCSLSCWLWNLWSQARLYTLKSRARKAGIKLACNPKNRYWAKGYVPGNPVCFMFKFKPFQTNGYPHDSPSWLWPYHAASLYVARWDVKVAGLLERALETGVTAAVMLKYVVVCPNTWSMCVWNFH